MPHLCRGNGGELVEARFERIFEETYRKTLAYALRRTSNVADAHDVVSETYLVAWRRREELLEVREPQAWLYAVAFKTLSNQRRANKRQEDLAIRAAQAHASGADLDPASSAEARVELESVILAIAHLSERDQEILRLAAFEGLDHHTIGVVLGVRAPRVRSLLYRARGRLDKALAGLPERQRTPSGHIENASTPDVGNDQQESPHDE